MRLFSVLFIAFMMGCGAATTSVPVETAPPVEEQPNVLASKCLEVTAPSGWQLSKGETVRPTQAEINEGSAYGTFSAMLLQRGADDDITIIQPHNDGEMAGAMFLNGYVGMVINASNVQENPEAAAEQGVVSMVVSPIDPVPGLHNSLMYTAVMEETGGTVVRGWFLIMDTDPADENSSVIVNTTVPPEGADPFSEEVLSIIGTMRFLCADETQ